ncbi:hypothetical protein KJS94_02840 [Flavihumibacter rivuli]|uniref:hypothetical protein n=1 Tax=Flavihumibacter rivuli TaxID=2838156 RepID=UPI001BDDFC29|nr:hypothetical protein [Flavihumibacter rivuli]ULQ57133.1 hypothetical protein KJS94_02840 [Flavihumibacter rivuli]
MTVERILLLCLIICLGCSCRTNDKYISLAIPEIGKATDPKEPPPPPLSPYAYYGCFNFIFDSTGAIYFYQHFYDRDKKPIRVIDFDSNAPIFINLNPDKIISIPADGVKSFVEQNVLKADAAFRSVTVIGLTDTIKSKSLIPLMNILTDTLNDIAYLVRKTTFEENVVLDYKRKQKFYYPDKVNWDSTKVLFDRKRKNSGT